MPSILTPRLELVSATLAMIEAVMLGRREDAEAHVAARMPDRWPNRELVERAFTASLEAIRADPETRLWGDRVVVSRDQPRRVLGSVVFHGRPRDDGIAEIAYGVEEASQGRGVATEAVGACVEWALAQSCVVCVQAATFAWHRPSVRVMEKVGMTHVGVRDHETLGELVVYERRRAVTRIPCGALLLDLDGLMVDSEPLWFEVERDFARERGGAWTHEMGDACIGRGMAHTLAHMSDAFGFEVDPARDAEVIVDAFVARVGDLALKPGCAEILEAARAHAVRCAVASSSARRLVDAVLARFALHDRLDAIVSGDQVRRPKPAPDVFLEAAARLGAAPARCVVLEDSMAGVAAARAAGMRVVAVPERDLAAFARAADAVASDLHAAAALLAFAPSAG